MLKPLRNLGPYMSKWLYFEILATACRTSGYSTKLILILEPSSKAGFRIRVIIIPKVEKITGREEGQKLVLTERISPLS